VDALRQPLFPASALEPLWPPPEGVDSPLARCSHSKSPFFRQSTLIYHHSSKITNLLRLRILKAPKLCLNVLDNPVGGKAPAVNPTVCVGHHLERKVAGLLDVVGAGCTLCRSKLTAGIPTVVSATTIIQSLPGISMASSGGWWLP